MTENTKNKWIHVRLSEREYDLLQRRFAKTTEKKLSPYLRKMLLAKPLIGAYRNQSLEEIIAELFKLRKDLHGVANNFNQAVHKLHTLDHFPEQKAWFITHELEKRLLLKSIEEIKTYINRTIEKWLQS